MIWRYQNNGNETGLRSTGKMEMKQVYEALEKLRTVLTSSLLSKAKLTPSTTKLRGTARQESRARQS